MKIWTNDNGAVNSVELIIAAVLVAFGLGAGLEKVRDSVNRELDDLSWAIESLDNSFTLSPARGNASYISGSAFEDTPKKATVYKYIDQERTYQDMGLELSDKQRENYGSPIRQGG